MDETPPSRLRAHTFGQADDASKWDESPRPASITTHVSALISVSSQEPLSLEEASEKILYKLAVEHSIRHAYLALHLGDAYIRVAVVGFLTTAAERLNLNKRDAKLIRAATDKRWVALSKFDKTFSLNFTAQISGASQLAALVPQSQREPARAESINDSSSTNGEGVGALQMLPFVIGGELQGALVIADKHFDLAKKKSVGRFWEEYLLPLEILRLRRELERSERVADHLQNITQRVLAESADDAYAAILTQSTNLVHGERASLLIYDELVGELSVKAVTGPRAEERRAIRVRLGDGVAGGVLQRGLPLIVGIHATREEYSPASANRSYKTTSFISFPIILGGRRVGVLNVTDKDNGAAYDELDLGLLQMITPQLVLALDCAGWQQKATRFQLLSITDPLTELLNRRYLEERLAEEIERSKRSHVPMSFMMIDIDDFKVYNDHSGHQAGDLALEMTAQNLKSALRSADVAARYGGEEFCVLLPGTNIHEAHTIAQRIRRRVERTRYPHGTKQPLGCVTVSIGISTFNSNTDSPVSMINAADQCLYTAKRLGKNRVEPQI